MSKVKMDYGDLLSRRERKMATTKTELKAYLATLKGLAKSRKNTFNFVYVGDNQISATDGNHIFTLKTGVKAAGSCDLTALTTYEIDQDLDLTAHSIDREWISEPKLEEVVACSINDKLAGQMVEAAGVVSKDEFRPILQDVVFDNGWVLGTDGFRAFVSLADFSVVDGAKNLNTRFDPTIMTAFKRLAKYGNWLFTILKSDHDRPIVRLENEHFSMIAPVREEGYPDMVGLVNRNTHFDTMVEIPLRDLAKYADKDCDLRIESDLTLSVVPHNSEYGNPTPLKATITEVSVDINTEDRLVICPLAGSEKRLGLNIALLKSLMDKSGACKLYWNRGTSDFLDMVR